MGLKNVLRQSLYYNFDYYHDRGEGAFKNSDEILRFHVCKCFTALAWPFNPDHEQEANMLQLIA